MAKRKDLIKGVHAIEEALESGHAIRKVFVQKGLNDQKLKIILSQLRKETIPVQYVPKEKLNKLSGNHQGIIGLSAQVDFYDLEQLVPVLFEKGNDPLLCMLDGVTDVRNFGAIARSARFLGVDALIIPMYGSADLNEDAIKASAGALLKVPVCRVKNAEQTIQFLKDSGFYVAGASEKANKEIQEADFKRPALLVLGAEDKGMSPAVESACHDLLRIPAQSAFDSLNVSVAAGIFFYQAQQSRSS